MIQFIRLSYNSGEVVSRMQNLYIFWLARMSLVGDSKAGESWTELDPADDSTYSLPIFLSVGKYSVAVAVMVKLLRWEEWN